MKAIRFIFGMIVGAGCWYGLWEVLRLDLPAAPLALVALLAMVVVTGLRFIKLFEELSRGGVAELRFHVAAWPALTGSAAVIPIVYCIDFVRIVQQHGT